MGIISHLIKNAMDKWENRIGNDNEHQGVLQQRDGDAGGLLPPVCTVNQGGLIDLSIDALQTCQQEHHPVAAALPGCQHHDARPCASGQDFQGEHNHC